MECKLTVRTTVSLCFLVLVIVDCFLDSVCLPFQMCELLLAFILSSTLLRLTLFSFLVNAFNQSSYNILSIEFLRFLLFEIFTISKGSNITVSRISDRWLRARQFTKSV